jgi:DNA-binding transcriptional MerR regulator
MSDHRENFWSIGEVLSLLQDEFPEVTISKIRFLESQGLIDPERTASGYRRFYQRDFDRLQWILTQQRDHYLPLKVIRDRLDAGEWEPPEHPPGPPPDGQMTLLAPVIDIGTGAAVVSGDDAAVAAEGEEPGGDAADAVEQATADTTAETVDPSDVAEAPSTSASAEDDPDHEPGVDQILEDRGMALTIDEMAEASGCDVAMIRELERFGLISGRTAGPAVLYDVDALTIARHAAQFRTYGLDPRHLRTFLVGAQREVSLLAQVVEPLRHRRDPETRRKSVETMEDLTDLAASLRAILMRRITEDQLPSQ